MRRTRPEPLPPADLTALLDASPNAVLLLDAKGGVVYRNRAAQSLFGAAAAALDALLARTHPDDGGALRELLGAPPADGGSSRLTRFHVEGEGWRYYETAARRLPGRAARPLVGFFCSPRPSADTQGRHDALTQLPNRTLLYERLAEVFDDPDDEARVGLCYLDVDGFNVINDTLGHDIGDHLLVAVARRLHTAVADADTLVARVGGDEFVVLVDGRKSNGSVVEVAEQALAAVRAPVRLGAHEVTVSASAGVVERAIRGTSAGELMKAADTTLSWAKADGKNRLALFDADRHAQEVTRYQLSASMPAALDRGEFFVEYQPLVRLRDAAVTGVEALVRWRHPTFGLLGPDNFIGLAEETGLIVPLGRWVLTQACQQAAAWRAAHPDRELISSVNVAVRQVHDPGIVRLVSGVLAETGLDPSCLQLELTESAVMSSPGEPLDTLYALADLGVRIAIDDFGTGYSNLAYLRRLPVHSLKLAGSFLAGLRSAHNPDRVDQEIVATLIKLAHTLNLTVTAEGVETAEQAARLRAMWCDTAQGWYYAQPGPAASMDEMLA